MSLLTTLKTGVKLPYLNGAGRGGPNRLVTIVGLGVLLIAIPVGFALVSEKAPPESKVAKMPRTNLLPGGTESTPAQEALRLKHVQEEAGKAEAAKLSYTPPMPGSQLSRTRVVSEPGLEGPVLEPVQTPKPVETPLHIQPVPPPVYVAPERPASPKRLIQRVNSTGGAETDPEMKKAVNDLFSSWDGRQPRTDILIPRPLENAPGGNAPAGPVKDNVSLGTTARPEVILVPAGRGVYAHTILSVNSDSGGPIVLEADTGPLMGDRMIGSFSKSAGDRLVVHVTRVEHGGKSLEVNGIVLAPDSMETSVASSIDEHVLERFVLPAGIAFIEGLGQAVALSNSTIQTTPYGSTVQSFGPLQFKQQAEIAAGTSAQTIGAALNSQIPKGPTVHLEANVGVGVMFLTNVATK
jgi:intracellular multiplication protein IcmE